MKKPRYIDTNLSESNRALLSAWIDKREARLVIREWRRAEEISAYRAMTSRRRFKYELGAHEAAQREQYWQRMAQQQQSLAGAAMAQQQNALSQYSQGFGLGLLGESFFKKH